MPNKINIKIFIASSNELIEEREKCIFLFNKLGKVHDHLDLEAVQWEYDLEHRLYPEYKDAQSAINEKLEECQFCIFIFYSKIGKYTHEEFELAKILKREAFILFKKGFSPSKQQMATYGELLDFKEALMGKAIPIEYTDINDFEQKITDQLNLYLSKKHPAITEETVTALSQTNQELIRQLAEKENEIKELKESNDRLPYASLQAELSQLLEQKEAIEKQLLQSEEIQKQLANDKEALEKQLVPQIEHDNLKAKALEEIEKGNYAEAENYLKESAKASVEEAASTFFELAKIKKLQLQYPEAFGYYELAAKVDATNSLYLNEAGIMAKTMALNNKAIDYYERALLIDKEKHGEEHPNIATRYNNIGSAYYGKGEYDKAIEFAEKALNIDKKLHGEEHPNIATRYNNIGLAYYSKGEYDKAIEFYKKAEDIDKKFDGEEHPNIATRYSNIGLTYDKKGEHDIAIEFYEKALNIGKKFHGEEHPNIATRYNNIGLAYTNKEEYDKAIEFYEKALNIGKKFYGEEHPSIAAGYNNIGLVYNKKGERDKAIELYKKALNIDKKFYGEEHPSIAIRYNNIGSVYHNKKQYDKAIEFYEKALNIFYRFLPPDHSDIKIVKKNLELCKKKGKED